MAVGLDSPTAAPRSRHCGFATIFRTFWTTGSLSSLTAGMAQAADPENGGKFELTSCWSGVANTISFSKGNVKRSVVMYGQTDTSRRTP